MSGRDSFLTRIAAKLIAREIPDDEVEPLGDFQPVTDACIDAEDISWLLGALGEHGELRAERVQLDTTEGTFVFRADSDTVIVEHENDE